MNSEEPAQFLGRYMNFISNITRTDLSKLGIKMMMYLICCNWGKNRGIENWIETHTLANADSTFVAYRATSLKYSSRCFSFLLHLIYRSLPQVAPAHVVTCFHPRPAGLAGNDSLVNRFTDSHHTIHEKTILVFYTGNV